MKSVSKYLVAYITALCCAVCFVVLSCEAQTASPKVSGDSPMQQRIAVIFRETLQRGEGAHRLNGRQPVISQTFIPPSSKDVEEIRHYGKDAVPVLANYLNSGTGFEKYLAMRFLGSIGGASIVEPLRKVVLGDASASFRLAALLWLSAAPWELAAPIIHHAAQNDGSPEVREKAGYLLAQQQLF